MPPFLQSVAEDLLRRFPDGLHHVTVVFPGKRARLFLNEYIWAASGRAVWTPTTHTMQELFLSLSPNSLLDDIEAICRLHKIYCRHLPEDSEPLDEFFGWGTVMLADFNDIDKHLVDANAFFTNIKDLEDLTSDRFLTPEQEATLQRFFASFSVEGNTLLRERFRRMWAAMPAIYNDFRNEMIEGGQLTEGALYRDVIRRMKEGRLPALEADADSQQVYAFVGLNVLVDAEKQLMHRLKAQGRALFYWDYDQAYMDGNAEAGIFMADNLKEFPNALPGTLFNNLHSHKKFTYVATAGVNVQAHCIPQWLQNLTPSAQPPLTPDTAIVLCDETLLEPVLHAIPDAKHGGPATANITMGYPMTSTPVYSLMRAVMRLHTNGWDPTTGKLRTYERHIVERNPLIRNDVKEKTIDINVHREGGQWLVHYMLDLLEFVAGRHTEEGIADELLSESIFRAYTMLQRVDELMEKGVLDVGTGRLCSIIDQAIAALSVPFHGEPAEGLQVMGILETRCLDFRNVLMLSVGEGKMPSSTHTPSFIPYCLRRPFGLTTIEHKVGIQAYYFYRLLQRAENVTFVYNTANTDGVKNEMSRFLRQLLVEMRPTGNFPDQAIAIKPDVTLPQTAVIAARKTPAVLERIRSFSSLSPTALERYIRCQLMYYLHYIGGVEEFVDDDDEMSAAVFGSIFHESAQEIYQQFIGRPLTKPDLERYLAHNELQYVVDSKFDKLFLTPRGLTFENMDGALSLRRDAIVQYLTNLVRSDLLSLDHAQREVVGCEMPCQERLTLGNGQTVGVGGTIDRLDRVTTPDGTARLQIIDYKTMSRGDTNVKANMDSIFAQKKKYLAHIFQTFVYSLTLLDRNMPIQPTVFYTQDSAVANYSSEITFNDAVLTDFRPLADDFRNRLTTLVESIFEGESFVQTDTPYNCTYCPFKDICRL